MLFDTALKHNLIDQNEVKLAQHAAAHRRGLQAQGLGQRRQAERRRRAPQRAPQLSLRAGADSPSGWGESASGGRNANEDFSHDGSLIAFNPQPFDCAGFMCPQGLHDDACAANRDAAIARLHLAGHTTLAMCNGQIAKLLP